MIYPTCIYGFIEDNAKYILEYDFLCEYSVYCYLNEMSMSMGHFSEIYYGIECKLDSNTGNISICENDKQYVHELYKKFIEFKKNIDENFVEPKLGYYLCLDGDIDYSDRKTYVLDENLNNNYNNDEDDDEDDN